MKECLLHSNAKIGKAVETCRKIEHIFLVSSNQQETNVKQRRRNTSLSTACEKNRNCNKAQKSTLYLVVWRFLETGSFTRWCINSKRKEGNVMIWRVWNVVRSPLHESSLLLKEQCRCMCWLVVSYLGEQSLKINNPRHEWLNGLFLLLFDVKKVSSLRFVSVFVRAGLFQTVLDNPWLWRFMHKIVQLNGLV